MWSRTLNADGSKAGIPAPYSLARCWVAELVDAVEHCHAHNLVHRDLKPENLMLDARGPVSAMSRRRRVSRHSHRERRRGHVKLIDFGTSKDLEDSALNGRELCLAISAPRPWFRPKLGHDLREIPATVSREQHLPQTATHLELKHDLNFRRSRICGNAGLHVARSG